MQFIYNKFKTIYKVFVNALKGSTLYRLFGSDSIKASLFYKGILKPYNLLTIKNSSLLSYFKGSRFVKYVKFETAAYTVAVFAALGTAYTYIPLALLVVLFILNSFVRENFLKMPDEIDTLIYLFALIFYLFTKSFSIYTFFDILLYSVISTTASREKFFKRLSFVFILATAVSSVSASVKGIFAFEFYILTIPFAVSVLPLYKRKHKLIILLSIVLLAFSFVYTLSEDEIPQNAIVLGIFLCLRDVKFVFPAVIFTAAVFGVFSSLITRAAQYNLFFTSALLSFAVSSVFYLNLHQSVSRKSLVRSILAAFGAGLALYISGEKTRSFSPFFWLFTAIGSARLKFEKENEKYS